MNVAKISAVAELVSSVAIVVTLVYLTVETRQNTQALLAMSRQTALQADVSWIGTQIEHPELTSWNEPGLSDEDWARRGAYIVQYLRIREFAWFQYRNGTLDEATWQSYLRPTTLVFASERARAALAAYRGDPEFIAYLQHWLETGLAKQHESESTPR